LRHEQVKVNFEWPIESIMKAYSHSTDASSGLLQETGGFHEQVTGLPSAIFEEYDWYQPSQFPLQLQPQMSGESQSLPPLKDCPAERWLVPRRTA
jgi:hypothetical protein